MWAAAAPASPELWDLYLREEERKHKTYITVKHTRIKLKLKMYTHRSRQTLCMQCYIGDHILQHPETLLCVVLTASSVKQVPLMPCRPNTIATTLFPLCLWQQAASSAWGTPGNASNVPLPSVCVSGYSLYHGLRLPSCGRLPYDDWSVCVLFLHVCTYLHKMLINEAIVYHTLLYVCVWEREL